MRRSFLLFLLLVALPASAAVETTTIEGKVITAGGAAATGGTITATLSQAGTTDDTSSGESQRVGGRVTGTIGSTGDVTLTLVPNDAIIPAGTYYQVRISTTGPVRASWSELWSVTTSPDPVDIGDITRLQVAQGITVGNYILYVDTEPTGSCTSNEPPRYTTDSNKHCECVASTWSCSSASGGATTEAELELDLTDVLDVITDNDAAGGELSGSYPSPTISRAITPTWTGSHVFAAALTANVDIDWSSALSTPVFKSALNVDTPDDRTGVAFYGGFFDIGYDPTNAASRMGNLYGIAISGDIAGSASGPQMNNYYGLAVDLNGTQSSGGTTVGQVRGLDIALDASGAGITTTGAAAMIYLQTPTGARWGSAVDAIKVLDLAGAGTGGDVLDINSQSGGANEGNVVFAGGDWSSGHLRFGTDHFWRDQTNSSWREKNNSIPTGATDGNLFATTGNEGGDLALTESPTGTVDYQIAAGAVGNAELADMAANTIKLRNAGTSGDPGDVKISGLTEESSPTTGDWILGEDDAGNLRKYDVANLPTGGGGEANTGSNQGTDGVGVFDTKSGVDLQFRHVAPASSKLSVTLNGKDIDIDAVEANLTHAHDGSTGGGTIDYTDLTNRSHGAGDHTGDVIPAAAQDFGAYYFDLAGISTPANPGTGTRCYVVTGTEGDLCCRNSTGTETCMSDGGGSSNSFETHDTPAGTDPVADSATDTLKWLAGQDITITGNATTDEITVAFDGDLSAGTTLNGSAIQTGTDDDVPEAGDFGAGGQLDANGNVAPGGTDGYGCYQNGTALSCADTGFQFNDSTDVVKAGGFDVNAHATDGGELIIKEGQDDGSDTWSIKVPNSGLTAGGRQCMVTADGELQDACIDDGISLDNLTQITTRNYSSLQNRGHAIDGSDHTASGLTTGHVLRATGSTTFAFGAALWGDIDKSTSSLADITTKNFGTNYFDIGEMSAPANPGANISRCYVPTGDAGNFCCRDSAGAVTCMDDGPAGSGISTLNGQTGTTQTFSDVDDTNVLLTITSSSDDHEFALSWTGQLAATRGGTGSQYFGVAGPTAARTYTFPDASTTIVGTTDTQTLSSKTLTTPTIGDFTNAGHDHSNAAGGGTLDYADLTNRSHGAGDHTGDVIPAAAQDFGAYYFDLAGISTPANPGTGTRCYVVTGTEGDLCCRNSTGTETCMSDGTGGSGDVTDVGDCDGPACFTGTEGYTLTFYNASGNATLDFDGNQFNFTHPLAVDQQASAGFKRWYEPSGAGASYIQITAPDNLTAVRGCQLLDNARFFPQSCIQDSYLFNTGDSSSGTFTFTGQLDVSAGDLIAETGTAPSLATAGELAVDTSNDGQLAFRDDDGTRYLSARRPPRCRTIESLVTTDDDVPFWWAEQAVTITAVACTYTGATEPEITLTDESGNTIFAWTTAGTGCEAVATGPTYSAPTGNASIAATEGLAFDTVTAPAANAWTTICYSFTEDAQ